MAATAPAGGAYLDAAGLRTFYVKQGTGPAVFLVHGASPGATALINWGPTIAGLAAAGFTVYAFDQPGFGRTDNPTDYSVEFRVAHAQAFIAATGVERYSLIGNSVGGYLVARLALAAPERVHRLVIVASATLAPPGGSETQARFQEHARELRAYEPSLENMRRLTQGTLFNQALVTEEFVRERYEMSIGKNLEAARERAGMPAARPVYEELRTLPVKTLLVWGANDRGGTLEKALLLFRTIPGAELHVFDQCAHWPQWDHAARFNALVRDFLAADAT
ncbi:MAG TPA: alpha/beta hydrolase [Chloroflexota bacterium]|nr:alpha/beta hydrolase [Chloroflexota bacterium]